MRSRILVCAAVLLGLAACSESAPRTLTVGETTAVTEATTTSAAARTTTPPTTVAPTTTTLLAATTTTEAPTTTTTIDLVAAYEKIVLPGNCMPGEPSGAIHLSDQAYFQQIADIYAEEARELRATPWPTPEIAAAAEKVAAEMDQEQEQARQAAGALTVASMTGYVRQYEALLKDPTRMSAVEMRRLIGANHVPTEKELKEICAAAGLS